MISLIFKNQSIYFDEPNQAQPKDSSPEKLPDWVRGELQTGEQRLSDSWQCSSGEDNTLVLAASDAHRYAKTLCFTVLKTYSSFAIGSYIEAFSFFLIIRIWQRTRVCLQTHNTDTPFNPTQHIHHLEHRKPVLPFYCAGGSEVQGQPQLHSKFEPSLGHFRVQQWFIITFNNVCAHKVLKRHFFLGRIGFPF